MENILQNVFQRRNPDGLPHNLIRGIILNDIFDIDNPPEENARENILLRPVINLEDIDDRDVKLNFRFDKDDIPRLCQNLRIPELITTQSGYQATGIEGLCILLRRLAYPNRLCDLEQVFQRSSSALSDIINFVNTHIYDEFRHLLEDLDSLHWLNHNRLQQYAEVIVAKGGRVPNCWGFIDGTIRPICRPSVEQDYYSGHKRVHCIKYQCVVTPDGITVSELGAFEGRKHDAGMFRESGFYQQLEAKARLPNGNNFVIYGDQAYGIRELLLCPFPGHGINEDQHNFNASMSALRVAVEWSFSKLVAEFAFLDFKKNQKLLLQNVEAMYKTATILTNCHSCLYGNQTSTFFNIEPVPLEIYLNVNNN